MAFAIFLITVGALLIVASRMLMARQARQARDCQQAIDAFKAQGERLKAVRLQIQG